MATNHSLSKLSSKNLFQQQRFDYGNIDSETKLTVEQRASEIRSLIRQTAQDIVSIGQKLTEVKEKLKHGNFGSWLKAEFNWSLSSATKFMQVSEQFKDVNFTNLNFSTSALYILAAPSTPKEARNRALQLASHGEQITYSLAKLIVNHYRCIDDEKSSDREPNESNVNVAERNPIQTIDVTAQTIANEAVVDNDYTRLETKNARLQNFKITYAGTSFTIKSKPEEITVLFEQMQSNPEFAREIFTKAQLLFSSRCSSGDCKTASH
ncbi:DUF3102 domain-containing protein [Myxosarcina sp. GI1]|uniref:DUF3102 domain-containing protein n=1 Tax=Myxosarcina sp. GI1 TaxID=1541065 RepID=UPI00068B613D|nr:DUF3102 domain-containing protein [Myxosarcina sp. GI1]